LAGFDNLYSALNTVAAPSVIQFPVYEKWEFKTKAVCRKSIVRGGGLFVLREE
jgi:hypothetical protein